MTKAKHTRKAAQTKPCDECARLRSMVADLLRGVCPCHGKLDDPGPTHAAWCKWADPEYDGRATR